MATASDEDNFIDQLKALEKAQNALVDVITDENIDVFVPLYANTFPIATIAKAARRRQLAASIHVQSYDWNWLGFGSPPPFLSPRPLQLFFATEEEFKTIHAAGISFFAVPVSVFHPRYIFLSLPAGMTVDDPEVRKLEAELYTALSEPAPAKPSAKNAADLRWVSDIPDQAKMIVSEAQRRTGVKEPEAVTFWRARSLERSLGIRPRTPEAVPRTRKSKTPASSQIKAFVWSGPLASLALTEADRDGNDTLNPPDRTCLRDASRQSLGIRLPSFVNGFEDAEIRNQYPLYCCVGYKEGHRLVEYYKTGRHVEKLPWLLDAEKFRFMRGTPVESLCERIGTFFAALFTTADMANVTLGGDFDQAVRLDTAGMIEAFRYDYDKYCRTMSPISQLYSAGDYLRCLSMHHDAQAFRRLFP